MQFKLSIFKLLEEDRQKKKTALGKGINEIGASRRKNGHF